MKRRRFWGSGQAREVCSKATRPGAWFGVVVSCEEESKQKWGANVAVEDAWCLGHYEGLKV